jgi:hypothetical protein
VTPSDDLRTTLEKALKFATPPPPLEDEQRAVHSLLPTSAVESTALTTNEEQPPLHLSLSRPLILQTNQRAELRAALAQLAGETKR